MFNLGYPLTWDDRTTYANAREALGNTMTTDQVAEATKVHPDDLRDAAPQV
jgi:hypothetical protein